MDDYSIWKDFFDTIQSFPDWLKLLLALIPPTLIAILTHQYYSYRLRRAAIDHAAAAAAAAAARGSSSGNVSAVAGKRGGPAVRSGASIARSAGQLPAGSGRQERRGRF